MRDKAHATGGSTWVLRVSLSRSWQLLVLIYIIEARAPQNDSMVPVGVLGCWEIVKVIQHAAAIPDALGGAIE